MTCLNDSRVLYSNYIYIALAIGPFVGVAYCLLLIDYRVIAYEDAAAAVGSGGGGKGRGIDWVGI